MKAMLPIAALMLFSVAAAQNESQDLPTEIQSPVGLISSPIPATTAQQPWQVTTGEIPFTAGSGSWSWGLYGLVPAGKVLVVEHVSARITYRATNGAPFREISINARTSQVIAEDSLPCTQIGQSVSAPATHFACSVQTKIYVPPGGNVFLALFFASSSPGGNLVVFASGHFENTQ